MYFTNAHGEMSSDDGEGSVDVDACLGDEQQDVVQLYFTLRHKLQLPHLYHAHHYCHCGNTGKTSVFQMNYTL